MEHCTQEPRFKIMENDINSLKRDIHGQGDEIGIKGAFIRLSETMDKFSNSIDKRDKSIDSIIEANRKWEAVMSVKKEFEIKADRRKNNLRWIIGTIITILALIAAYITLLQ